MLWRCTAPFDLMKIICSTIHDIIIIWLDNLIDENLIICLTSHDIYKKYIWYYNGKFIQSFKYIIKRASWYPLGVSLITFSEKNTKVQCIHQVTEIQITICTNNKNLMFFVSLWTFSIDFKIIFILDLILNNQSFCSHNTQLSWIIS